MRTVLQLIFLLLPFFANACPEEEPSVLLQFIRHFAQFIRFYGN
ncbi:MAG: hypothetical protein V4722_25430 [Bacteroidota bacterium]